MVKFCGTGKNACPYQRLANTKTKNTCRGLHILNKLFNKDDNNAKESEKNS